MSGEELSSNSTSPIDAAVANNDAWPFLAHHTTLPTSDHRNPRMTIPPPASLLGLPAELRVSIMESLFSDDDFTIDFHCECPTSSPTRTPRGALALPKTCRLLRREAFPVQPSMNDIRLCITNLYPTGTQTWERFVRRQIGERVLNKTRKLEISVHGLCKAVPHQTCPRRLVIVNHRIPSTRSYQDVPLRDWMDRDTRTLLANLSPEYARRNLDNFFCCETCSQTCIAATMRELFEPLGDLFINGMRKPMTPDTFMKILKALSTDHTILSAQFIAAGEC